MPDEKKAFRFRIDFGNDDTLDIVFRTKQEVLDFKTLMNDETVKILSGKNASNNECWFYKEAIKFIEVSFGTAFIRNNKELMFTEIRDKFNF